MVLFFGMSSRFGNRLLSICRRCRSLHILLLLLSNRLGGSTLSLIFFLCMCNRRLGLWCVNRARMRNLVKLIVARKLKMFFSCVNLWL